MKRRAAGGRRAGRRSAGSARRPPPRPRRAPRGARLDFSGSCRCALIGVPCRLSMLSTFSTFANILF